MSVDLPVLIVSFRAADLLEKCLISVKTFHSGQDVLVWDNTGPMNSEIRDIAARYPEFAWHFSDRNIGFAAAVNRLTEQIPGRDFLLLNPDAELIAPLDQTLSLMQLPRTAAAGPMVDDASPNSLVRSGQRRVGWWRHSTEMWDSCYRRLTFLNALGSAAGLGRRLRGSPFSRSYRTQPQEVDGYITGCCLAIRREAWDEIGEFDEQYFLYGEEARWQRTATEAGWTIRLADEVAVRHSSRGTVRGERDRSQRSEDLLRSSLALQIEQIYGHRAADFYLAWCSVLDSMKLAFGHASAPTARREGDVLVTADGPDRLVRSRIDTALALEQAGKRVTMVSLQPLGIMPRELPPSIRLVRLPWWWPWLPGEGLPSVMLPGVTARERAFSRLMRLRGMSMAKLMSPLVAR